ncbi:MAG: hypothetical protein U9N81_10130 [Bacillota bacterium]|nr:hypothetical protein [Bacillota bacterium]
MFKTIDSAFIGPYSVRIEKEINQTIHTIYKKDPEAFVVLATRYSPENGVNFTSKWPQVWTLLQRDEYGEIQIVLGWGNDPFIELGAWELEHDEMDPVWLQFPFEKDE